MQTIWNIFKILGIIVAGGLIVVSLLAGLASLLAIITRILSKSEEPKP